MTIATSVQLDQTLDSTRLTTYSQKQNITLKSRPLALMADIVVTLQVPQLSRSLQVCKDSLVSQLALIYTYVCLTAPSPPRDVTVRQVGPLMVEVQWRPPAMSYGNVTHYTVYAIPVLPSGNESDFQIRRVRSMPL